MRYSETVRTRLTPEQAKQVHDFAERFEIGISTVVRLAVKRFFETEQAHDHPASTPESQ